jgi:hypothetical protein
MMSLEVKEPDHLARVFRFAMAKGLTDKLLETLWYMHTFAERTEHTPHTPPPFELTEAAIASFPPPEWQLPPAPRQNKTTLQRDWAPASFAFSMTLGLSGGVIYHGDQAGWDDKPGYVDPLSVLIGDVGENPWSVHT